MGLKTVVFTTLPSEVVILSSPRASRLTVEGEGSLIQQKEKKASTLDKMKGQTRTGAVGKLLGLQDVAIGEDREAQAQEGKKGEIF